MLTEGLLTESRRSAERGFDMYCRLEGVDRRYLLSDLHKNGQSRNSKNIKKTTILPSIHITRPNN